MSELEQNTAVEEAVKEPQVSQDEKKTEQAVPYYRFQELVKERNDLKSKVQEVATAQEEQRKKTLEEQGEYKALLIEEQNKNKELETKFSEVSESFNQYVTQERDSLLGELCTSDRRRRECFEGRHQKPKRWLRRCLDCCEVAGKAILRGHLGRYRRSA